MGVDRKPQLLQAAAGAAMKLSPVDDAVASWFDGEHDVLTNAQLLDGGSLLMDKHDTRVVRSAAIVKVRHLTAHAQFSVKIAVRNFADENAPKCAFAGAITSEEPDDFPRSKVQRYPIECQLRTESSPRA